eukprot:scaffold12312_cov248-Ochromonas_danica.AAC.6
MGDFSSLDIAYCQAEERNDWLTLLTQSHPLPSQSRSFTLITRLDERITSLFYWMISRQLNIKILSLHLGSIPILARAISLMETYPQLPSIEFLRIDGSIEGIIPFRTMQSFLQCFPNLHTINCESCLQDEEVFGMANAAAEIIPSLKRLLIPWNSYLSVESLSLLCRIFSQEDGPCGTLEAFTVPSIYDSQLIPIVLSQLVGLRYLGLCCDHLSLPTIGAIVYELPHLQHLRLFLSENQFIYNNSTITGGRIVYAVLNALRWSRANGRCSQLKSIVLPELYEEEVEMMEDQQVVMVLGRFDYRVIRELIACCSQLQSIECPDFHLYVNDTSHPAIDDHGGGRKSCTLMIYSNYSQPLPAFTSMEFPWKITSLVSLNTDRTEKLEGLATFIEVRGKELLALEILDCISFDMLIYTPNLESLTICYVPQCYPKSNKRSLSDYCPRLKKLTLIIYHTLSEKAFIKLITGCHDLETLMMPSLYVFDEGGVKSKALTIIGENCPRLAYLDISATSASVQKVMRALEKGKLPRIRRLYANLVQFEHLKDMEQYSNWKHVIRKSDSIDYYARYQFSQSRIGKIDAEMEY